MSRDNWERLVAAVVKREQIWQLCHDHSRTPSISTISSDSGELILDTRIELNSVSPPPQGTLSKLSISQAPDSGGPWDGKSSAPITIDKSVEFSYEELANATNDFNIANKIGKFIYGSAYYAELRGEKAAIKEMDLQASQYFLTELKVLKHVRHPQPDIILY